MRNTLEIKTVSKSFGNQKVLDDISIQVPEAKIFGLLGPNGAGKTTLIRIINQIINLDHGEITFLGQAITRKDVYRIGYLPEERGLYSKMKVGEHLLYMARLKGMPDRQAKDTIRKFLDEFDIFSWWNKKVEQLSKGMQQKLQFIIAIMHNPKLIILDEPFTGFDPVNIELVKNKIRDLKKNGTTFILSTHRMDSVEELCDHIALINKSKKVIEGDKSDIKNTYKQNIFQIECAHDLKADLSHIAGSEQIDSVQTDENKYAIRFKLNQPDTLNQLIESLIKQTQIYSVNEMIPTINEIFISLVNNQSNE